MKKPHNKLRITTETLRILTAGHLEEVRGAGILTTLTSLTTIVTVCPTKEPDPSSPYGCATDFCPIKK